MITAAIYTSSLKTKKIIPEQTFLPDYLGEKRAPVRKEKTREQQRAEFLAFKAKLKAVRPDWVKEK